MLANCVVENAHRAEAYRGAGDVSGVPVGALVVGMIARLVPVKDHATLLRAAAPLVTSHPDLHLVLVGDGSSRAALESLAAELFPPGRVVFTGMRENGAILPGNKTHNRRRRLTRSWWNDVWRDRLLAAVHFLVTAKVKFGWRSET